MDTRKVDPALAAMKRAARAILWDELRAHRAEIKKLCEHVTNNQATVSELQRRLADSEAAKTRYSCDLGRLNSRLERASEWAKENAEPQGNKAASVLLEWVRGEPAQGPRSGFWINPFDRWGVTPRLP